MRFPTIDETRAITMIIAAVAFAVIAVVLVVNGKADQNLIILIITTLLGLVHGLEGVVMVKRNSTGKAWDDPHGQKQDTLSERAYDLPEEDVEY